MRIERVGKDVLLVIRVRIRFDTRLDQCQFQPASADGMAVLAVIQQADAISAFRHVHPLMAAAFKPRPVPAGVGMSFSHHIAELDVKRRLIRVYICRESGL